MGLLFGGLSLTEAGLNLLGLAGDSKRHRDAFSTLASAKIGSSAEKILLICKSSILNS